MKKLLTVILAMALLMSVICANVYAENQIDSKNKVISEAEMKTLFNELK